MPNLLISPPGVAAYVWLDKPDPGPKDHPAAFPKHKVTVVYNKDLLTERALAWLQSLMSKHADVDGGPKSCPVKDGDRFKGDGPPKFPNSYFVKFSTKYPPDLVDTQRVHLPPNMRISSGDLIRVAYTEGLITEGANPGLSLRMNAVQLIEKRALSHSHIAGQAFDEIEGFTVEDWHKIHAEAGDADADTEDKTDF